MKLKMELIKVPLFRGSPIAEKAEVIASREYEYSGTQAYIDDFQAGNVYVNLSKFVADNGYPDADPRKFKIVQVPGMMAFTEVLQQETEYFVFLEAITTKDQPVKQEESVEREGPSTDEQVGRIFSKWHRNLNKLKVSKAELEAKQFRTPEENLKLQQTIGAINALSSIISDLQVIRPVNQSVLNI